VRLTTIFAAAVLWAPLGSGQTAPAAAHLPAVKSPAEAKRTNGASAKAATAKSGTRTALRTAGSPSGKAPTRRAGGRVQSTSRHTSQHISQHISQQQPAPDRYREIQEALAERGYFRGTADGTWGADSIDALKRFQTDQNLDADGKIGALSLIALGLGPKRESAAAPPVSSTSPSTQESLEPGPAAPVAAP
jgi:murein L,D-transpeptidase YcbB/YkuD